MIKNFFRHWHYGVKARVVDGALVANLDTAIEPALIRIAFDRISTVALDVQVRNAQYELVLTSIGTPTTATTIAKFEVRDAAEEAAACLRCALLKGQRARGYFCKMFAGTFGLAAALLLILVLAAAIGTGGNSALISANVGGSSLAGGANVDVESVPGEPMSADQFLR